MCDAAGLAAVREQGMRSWVGLAALLLSAPVGAASYHIVLDRPVGGRLLTGYGGVQAADERTRNTLVRVISPGNTVDRRGTVRVLVMNFGPTPFTFGPDEVTVRLGDGTVLAATPVDQFEKGRKLIERESGYGRAIDLRNSSELTQLAEQTGGASGASTPAAGPPEPSAGQASLSHDMRTGDSQQGGAELLDAIYQLLIPLNVGQQQAWGGYYVFDVPAAVQHRRSDLPMAITVRTGAEEHRFSATLRWK
jgi:hypothetical protein